MSLINKVKANMKSVPKPVYVLAAVVPLGFCVLGLYILLRPEPMPKATLHDAIEQMIAEEKK